MITTSRSHEAIDPIVELLRGGKAGGRLAAPTIPASHPSMVRLKRQTNLQPYRNDPMQVFVPYDVETGKVYLNAIGATEDAAAKPFVEGAIEVEGDIDFATALLVVGDEAAQLDHSLFPCVIPFNGTTGEPLIEGIGSSETEARVNVEYANQAPENFSYITGALRMNIPVLDESPKSNGFIGS